VSTFAWSFVAYFALVFWGAMFSLAERIGTPSMWHPPMSKPKRSAVLLVAVSTFLGGPFLNRPHKGELCWLVIALSLILAYGLSDYLKRKQRNIAAFCLTFSVGCVSIMLVAWHFWPVRQIPLFTLKTANAGLPVSVPPRSTLLILPLHPYQTFTHANSHLHEYENDCSEARNWPSQAEIDSKSVDGYEEVLRIEIANHSQAAMESGVAAFDILYGESFGGGCIVPRSREPQQRDVVSIPALDPGHSFEFVAVNQTDRCAWLLLPTKITVKMENDEDSMEIPIKFEPGVVSSLASPPFVPTAIKWYGVPTKNPGYGMARSGADCHLPVAKP
jgi:hypothetical protein